LSVIIYTIKIVHRTFYNKQNDNIDIIPVVLNSVINLYIRIKLIIRVIATTIMNNEVLLVSIYSRLRVLKLCSILKNKSLKKEL